MVVLSYKIQYPVLDCIPANGRLCTLRHQGSFGFRKDGLVKRTLFVLSAYSAMGSRTGTEMNKFYEAFNTLVRRSNGSGTLVLVDDFNAQVDKSSAFEPCSGAFLFVSLA